MTLKQLRLSLLQSSLTSQVLDHVLQEMFFLHLTIAKCAMCKMLVGLSKVIH